MKRQTWGRFLVGWALLLPGLALAETPCTREGYQVGAARDDITGPMAEVGMMGYADLSQKTEGLHMRLWSRAMVVSDGCRQKTVAVVVADLGQIFGGLKDAIISRLQEELPGVFNHSNVLISATHTHAGPGGFAHHALYNITTLGFSPLNFEVIVKGTVQSIVKAYRTQAPSRLLVTRGDLHGIQFNRSPEAYAENPAAEREAYGEDHDPDMLLVKAESKSGQPLAAFNWYGVHGVSLPMENRLISGDNKGMAAYLLEKTMGVSYLRDGEFIGAFAQASAGDISPYDVSHPIPKDIDYFARNEASGRAQFEKAQELMQTASEELRGPIRVSHKYADLANREVAAAFTAGQGAQRTCQAALGVSFAAGTENGQPVGLFKEGTIYGKNWAEITLMPEEQDCHDEKVILLPTGFVKPDPWTARVVPFQLVRIGQLAIIAAPFEITTMAGRRLKEQVLRTMAADGVRYVTIASLANEYIHYVTTREEYQAQSYEGGSTLYGPWSLAAYTQIFTELAEAQQTGRLLADEGKPLDLSQKQVVLNPGVIFDAPPIGRNFGDVRTPPQAQYTAGERVEVAFWGAHPNSSLGRDRTLLVVQHDKQGIWQSVRYDWDPDTFYMWKREGLAASEVRIAWQSPVDAPRGRYRICHFGHFKPLLGSIKPYQGCTEAFNLQ